MQLQIIMLFDYILCYVVPLHNVNPSCIYTKYNDDQRQHIESCLIKLFYLIFTVHPYCSHISF